MNVFKMVRLAIATCVLVAAGSSFASAEIIFMTSGNTVSVKKHANVGESVVLTLRSGGEVTLDKTLIDKIVPDEVEHPEPAPQAVAEQIAASAQPDSKPGPGLRDTAYAKLITAAAEAHGVPANLVQALIQVESNYQPRARSNKGAMGLMQLMPSTAKAYKVRNAYDPAANIAAGVKKLKGLIDTFAGNTSLALAAYNAGEAAVQKFNGIPPYRETQNYVSRILSISGLNKAEGRR